MTFFMVKEDKEYSVKLLINVEMVTSFYAKDNEELKDKAVDFIHNMDPLKAHYILQCGRKTVLKSEDGTKYERLSLNTKD
jgi:hypothetical protein